MIYSKIPERFKSTYTKKGQNRGLWFQLDPHGKKRLTIAVQTIVTRRQLEAHIKKLRQYGRFI